MVHDTGPAAEALMMRDGAAEQGEELSQLFMQDPYFAELGLSPGNIVSQCKLLKSREMWDFLPSASALEEAAEAHRSSIMAMKECAKGLQSASTQWKSNLGALRKAQLEEKKSAEKEQAGRPATWELGQLVNQSHASCCFAICWVINQLCYVLLCYVLMLWKEIEW